jgi:type I restriction enzyme, S subunit
VTNWTTRRLGELANSVEYGVTASATEQPRGPKFLRITDIQNGAVNWETVPWCECDSRSAAEARLKAGDIVFARTGATTGKSFLIRDCPDEAVFASYLIRVRLGEEAEPRFVSHFFQTPNYWAQITRSAMGVAQPGVNATKLKALQIPLPSLAEQRQIADVLDKAEALRAKRRAALTQLGTLTESMFLDLFGDPATNPKGWPYKTVGSLASKFSDGPFGSNLKSEHYVPSGVRVIRLQNIGVGTFVDDDAAYISEQHFAKLRKHECLPGDVLVGTLGDPNLRACVQPSWLTVALNKADCVQLRPDERVANADFLCALLNQPAVDGMAQELMHGQTRVRISMGRLRGLAVPVPPINFQREFARRVAAVEKLKAVQRASLAEIDALFASLQHRAFRGEL